MKYSKFQLKKRIDLIFLIILCLFRTDLFIPIRSTPRVAKQQSKITESPAPKDLKNSALMMDTNLTDANASFFGPNAFDSSGKAIAIAGDINADGYDDFLISSPGHDPGEVYLIFGDEAELFSRDTNLSQADASFIGEHDGDGAGQSIAGAGDVNGDGYDDILIGAIENDEGGYDTGQVYLILGDEAGTFSMDTNLSQADASFIGEVASDSAGQSIAGAGDVNGDGYDDILIGAIENDEGGDRAGQIYLIFGNESEYLSMDTDLSQADASFIGEVAVDRAGESIAGAGDINADGYDDILIGAPYNDEGGVMGNAGQVYLIFGNTSENFNQDTDLAQSSASFLGINDDHKAGFDITGAGDMNADGYDDILIGAIGSGVAGRVFLIFGDEAEIFSMDTDLGQADASFRGEAEGDSVGGAISSAGDVNYDGYDDILIGAYGNDEGGDSAGQTYLIYGNESDSFSLNINLAQADASFIGEDDNINAGYAVAGGGDVNGDGVDDIIIGAYAYTIYGPPVPLTYVGKTYLIFGYNIAPKWDDIPEDQLLKYETPLSYDINASDFQKVLYSLNDTVNFTIDSEGILENNTILEPGVYFLELNASDGIAHNLKTMIITIDNTYPEWDQIPQNKDIDERESLSYNINASDNVEIDSYWLNSSEFLINEEGIITNNTILSVGVYWLNISVNDTVGFQIQAIISITVNDITEPWWSETPQDQYITEGKPFSYDVDASDNVEIDTYWIDNTNFIIDGEGRITNSTVLAVGVYSISISVNDTAGNEISKMIKVTVEKEKDEKEDEDGNKDGNNEQISGFLIIPFLLITSLSIVIIGWRILRKNRQF